MSRILVRLLSYAPAVAVAARLSDGVGVCGRSDQCPEEVH